MNNKGPFVLGLTGSIGMGKSTTAGFFAALGVPVWDADAAVHRLYAKGGAAVKPLQGLVPAAIKDGAVDRTLLKNWIADHKDGLSRLEQLVHPLVAKDRAEFLDRAQTDGTKIVVLDIPLLFETGGHLRCDATLVVSAPPEIQQARVLDRAGMTEAHFKRILDKQMPDTEKRSRANYVIETLTLDQTKAAVQNLLETLNRRIDKHA